MLSDLRESGALEQDADVVCLLFRPDQYPDVKPEDENVAELNIAKQRNGPIGLVRLAFLKQETRFGNLEQRQMRAANGPGRGAELLLRWPRRFRSASNPFPRDFRISC